MPEQTREKMTHVHFPLVDNVEVIPFITCGDRNRERDRLSQSRVTSGLLTPPPSLHSSQWNFFHRPPHSEKNVSANTAAY